MQISCFLFLNFIDINYDVFLQDIFDTFLYTTNICFPRISTKKKKKKK